MDKDGSFACLGLGNSQAEARLKFIEYTILISHMISIIIVILRSQVCKPRLT